MENRPLPGLEILRAWDPGEGSDPSFRVGLRAQPSDTPHSSPTLCSWVPDALPALLQPIEAAQPHRSSPSQGLCHYHVRDSAFPFRWSHFFGQVKLQVQPLHSGFQHAISGVCQLLGFIIKIAIFPAGV